MDNIFDRLYKLHPKIIDLKLERVERLLSKLGNPEKKLPSIIHVAGTNGKGSTIAMIRAALKSKAKDQNLSVEERFKARLALAKLPRNSAPSRLHNRCLMTGRPKGYYRKIKMSRIALRDLASRGEIPGMIKSSW